MEFREEMLPKFLENTCYIGWNSKKNQWNFWRIPNAVPMEFLMQLLEFPDGITGVTPGRTPDEIN